jgi:hypothetical protein
MHSKVSFAWGLCLGIGLTLLAEGGGSLYRTAM